MLQPKVTAVKPLPDYKLLLDFETGERKIFDVTPYIRGDWYGKLRDVDVFLTVGQTGRTSPRMNFMMIPYPHGILILRNSHPPNVPTWRNPIAI